MVKKLGYSLIFILLLVLGGAGWYFSGVIYNGGLNPEFTDSSSITSRKRNLWNYWTKW